jgi:hypothetical protein
MPMKRLAVWATIVVAGFSACKKKDAPAPSASSAGPASGATAARAGGGKAEVVSAALDTSRRAALRSDLAKLAVDHGTRSRQISQIAADPQVRSSARLAPVAKRLARAQAQAAVVLQRTRRYVATADPRLKAYEEQLKRELAEVNRLTHAMAELVVREQAAQVAQLMLDLDQANDAGYAAYLLFDRAFEQALAGVPPDAYWLVDVSEDLAAIPRSELLYTFSHELDVQPDDLAFFADAYGFDAVPAWDEVAAYEEMPDYAAPEGEDPVIETDVETPEAIAELEQEYDIEADEESTLTEKEVEEGGGHLDEGDPSAGAPEPMPDQEPDPGVEEPGIEESPHAAGGAEQAEPIDEQPIQEPEPEAPAEAPTEEPE